MLGPPLLEGFPHIPAKEIITAFRLDGSDLPLILQLQLLADLPLASPPELPCSPKSFPSTSRSVRCSSSQSSSAYRANGAPRFWRSTRKSRSFPRQDSPFWEKGLRDLIARCP